MRNVDREAAEAFIAGESFRAANTLVCQRHSLLADSPTLLDVKDVVDVVDDLDIPDDLWDDRLRRRWTMILFGNPIAVHSLRGNVFTLYDAKHRKQTTKNRLNAILTLCNDGRQIFQRDSVWYVRDHETDKTVEWSGRLVTGTDRALVTKCRVRLKLQTGWNV